MCNLWAVRCFCPAVLRLAGLADHRAGNLCASPGALTTRMAFHDVNVYILNILIGLINSETSGLAWHRLEISVRKVFDSVMFTFKQRLSPLHSLCVVHYVHAAFAPIMLLISQVAPLHWELLDLWGLDMTWHDFTWLHMSSHDLTDPCRSFHVISVSSSLCADGAPYHRKASRGRCIPEYGECLYDYWRRVQISREWNFDPGRVCGGRRSVSRMKSGKVHRDVTKLYDMQVESIKSYLLTVRTCQNMLEHDFIVCTNQGTLRQASLPVKGEWLLVRQQVKNTYITFV